MAQSRLELYFLQQISVLLLVLPLKLQLVSQQVELDACDWLSRGMAEGEDQPEFEVDQ